MRLVRSLAAAACVLAALAGGAAAADYADGLRAYDAGDYETALAEWRPLAEAGHAGAQVALAGLYEGGHGVPRDLGRAATWYRRAAEQGHAAAQMNLGEMYASGRGVPRDPVRAYVWLTRAADQGLDWAARRRDRLAGRMSADERAAARAELRRAGR